MARLLWPQLSFVTIGILLAICCCLVSGTTFKSDKCGKFYCPDHCNVTFKNGCPHNCNCRTFLRCPLVTCPAKHPICSIHTQLDGCQTCACKLPYLLVQRKGRNEPSFIFLGRDDPIETQLTDRGRSSGRHQLRFRGKKVLQGFMCSLPDMDKVDNCLESMMTFHGFLRSKRRDSIANTVNPVLRDSKEDMGAMCGHFGVALKCIGPKIYKRCRHKHPHLTQMDATFGFPCGKKQKLFFDHLDCIQKSHETSFRLFSCEDSAHRSMRYIENGDYTLKDKQKQKCQTMSWLMGCEQPVIQRRCSKEAGLVFAESLMAATEYVAPECYPNYRRHVFQPRRSDIKTIVLAEKQNLTCDAPLKREIDHQFNYLYPEISRMTKHATIAYPMGYVFTKRQLQKQCSTYNKVMKKIPGKAKNNCIRRYNVYDKVYYALEYPCGHGTTEYFLRYFECLVAVRYTSHMRRCERAATRQLADASNDPCEAYDILIDCMYDHVVSRCGYDGMELEFQYMSSTVKKYVPNCTLRRIFRRVNRATQTGRV